MRKKRMVKVFRPQETYTVASAGLFGNEQKVLESMFESDKKTPKKFDKLSSLQKKVLAKMKWQKFVFLKAEVLK